MKTVRFNGTVTNEGDPATFWIETFTQVSVETFLVRYTRRSAPSSVVLGKGETKEVNTTPVGIGAWRPWTCEAVARLWHGTSILGSTVKTLGEGDGSEIEAGPLYFWNGATWQPLTAGGLVTPQPFNGNYWVAMYGTNHRSEAAEVMGSVYGVAPDGAKVGPGAGQLTIAPGAKGWFPAKINTLPKPGLWVLRFELWNWDEALDAIEVGFTVV